jgi:hypothetical protein
MERQAGLGRSLEDVLDALAPVETDPSAPGRVLFEPRDLERQVDQLSAEINGLRERVQRLVGLVSDAAVVNGATNGTHHDPAVSAGDPEEAEERAAKKHAKKADTTKAEKHKKKKKKKKNKTKQQSLDG